MQTEATAAEIEKCRSAPAISYATANHAMTSAATHDESGLNYSRENRDGFRFVEQTLRYGFLAYIHYFREDIRSLLCFFGSTGKLLLVALRIRRHANTRDQQPGINTLANTVGRHSHNSPSNALTDFLFD